MSISPSFFGRSRDIATGKDWEGNKVARAIEVDPQAGSGRPRFRMRVLAAPKAVKLDAQEVPAEPVHADKLQAR